MGQNQSMMIKEINGKTINTRIPLRTGNIPELIEEQVPLCNYSLFKENDKENGKENRTIKFLYKKEIIEKNIKNIKDYSGLFSFVLYYRHSLNKFFNSKYYIGLLIYAEIIHKNEFFKNYAMVIYTDESTFKILKPAFSIYEKIIIAIVNWPKFAINDQIEDTILRCLRFHSLEAFPNSDIFIRDADTIFPTEIFSINHAYQMGVKGKGKVKDELGELGNKEINDYRIYMIDKIGEWEKTFIKKFNECQSKIIIGVNLEYIQDWHTEIPFETNDNNIAGFYLTSSLLRYRSPTGVFAGFINFKTDRPTDLWLYSFDYINSHYQIKNGKISNLKFKISIGKDERIILFTIIAKYWYLCYFFTIYYTDNIEYYTNNNIEKKQKNNFKCNNIINYHELLNLGTVKYKYKNNNEYSEKHIKVWTKILDPDFILPSYNKKITSELLNSCYSIRLKIKETDIGKTFNEFYQEIFKDFSKKYLEWLDKIRKASKEEILEKLKNNYKTINSKSIRNKLLRISIEDIKFVYNSQLPPIQFSENPNSNITPVKDL
jgi:hypothetical protein